MYKKKLCTYITGNIQKEGHASPVQLRKGTNQVNHGANQTENQNKLQFLSLNVVHTLWRIVLQPELHDIFDRQI